MDQQKIEHILHWTIFKLSHIQVEMQRCTAFKKILIKKLPMHEFSFISFQTFLALDTSRKMYKQLNIKGLMRRVCLVKWKLRGLSNFGMLTILSHLWQQTWCMFLNNLQIPISLMVRNIKQDNRTILKNYHIIAITLISKSNFQTLKSGMY